MPELDGIRGMAILLVMICHLRIYSGASATIGLDQAVFRVLTAGWVGVDLFFVLSGFLITGILFDAKGSDHYFRSFYMRRTLRIFPLYYGVLFLFLWVVPALTPWAERVEPLRQQQAWYWTYLVNWSQVHGWGDNLAFGHFWSLAVEEQFYLLWPLVVFVSSRRALQWICVGCVAGAIAVRWALVEHDLTTAAYVLGPARMDALAIGAFLAVTIRTPAGFLAVSRLARPIALASLLVIVSIFLWLRALPAEGNAPFQIFGYTVFSTFFGAVLVTAIDRRGRGRVAGVCRSSTLALFGRYSYALYVLHQPFLYYLPWRLTVDAMPRVLGSHIPALLVFSIGATTALVLLSMLSWHAYEKHFLKLKDLFPYRSADVGAQRAPAAAPQPAGSVPSPPL
jgi:peptidoglycan/LPS O-acetylase OafA/YrhL